MRRVPSRMLKLRLACIAAVCLAGCRERSPAAPTIPANATMYTTRGIVTRLPPSGAAASNSRSMFLHHEPIPAFTNWEGKAVGMGEMTMEFPLASTISLDGVAVGDAVEVQIAVWFTGKAGSWVTTSLVELPEGTELKLQDPPGKPAAPSVPEPAPKP